MVLFGIKYIEVKLEVGEPIRLRVRRDTRPTEVSIGGVGLGKLRLTRNLKQREAQTDLENRKYADKKGFELEFAYEDEFGELVLLKNKEVVIAELTRLKLEFRTGKIFKLVLWAERILFKLGHERAVEFGLANAYARYILSILDEANNKGDEERDDYEREASRLYREAESYQEFFNPRAWSSLQRQVGQKIKALI